MPKNSLQVSVSPDVFWIEGWRHPLPHKLPVFICLRGEYCGFAFGMQQLHNQDCDMKRKPFHPASAIFGGSGQHWQRYTASHWHKVPWKRSQLLMWIAVGCMDEFSRAFRRPHIPVCHVEPTMLNLEYTVSTLFSTSILIWSLPKASATILGSVTTTACNQLKPVIHCSCYDSVSLSLSSKNLTERVQGHIHTTAKRYLLQGMVECARSLDLSARGT